MTMRYASIDLAAQLRVAVSLFEILAREKRITISVDTPPALPADA